MSQGRPARARRWSPGDLASSRAVVVLAWALAGCGSASTPQVAPSPAPPPADVTAAPPVITTDLPPAERQQHIEDALGELTESERALDREIARRAANRQSSPPPTPKKPIPDKPTGQRPTAPSTPEQAEPKDRSCEIACVALASMRRSAAYVCKLAGDGDARCVDARTRVRRSEDKLLGTCGGCGAEPLTLVAPEIEWEMMSLSTPAPR
jgi:hypothetical protein